MGSGHRADARGSILSVMSTLRPPAAPTKVGRYLLGGKIASGGMAAVHLGRLEGAVGFRRLVAIKRLHPPYVRDPNFVAMLADEARLAAHVHHRNVVGVLDVVSEDGELALVMEYVRGESLSTLLDLAQTRVSYELAAAITRDVLHGLQAVHEARDDQGTPLGIVHRDVSPHNVLIGADGTARVSDFGIAKAVSRFQTTRAGQIKGKPRYMAPEQLRGQPVQPAADLYATGVVLWELLVGEPLFDARDDAQIYGLVLEGRIHAPRRLVADIPPELDALVMRALARDPAERFASARDMAAALERAIRPASSDEVGAWVRELVGEQLERRAQLFEDGEPSGVKARAATHTAVPEAGSTRTALTTETETLRVSIPAAPRRRWWWLAAVPAAGALSFGAVWVAAPRSTRMQSELVPRTEAHARQATAATTTSTSTVIEVPPEVFSADKPKPRVTAPRPVRKPNCNPPYVEDETGFRRIKPECL